MEKTWGQLRASVVLNQEPAEDLVSDYARFRRSHISSSLAGCLAWGPDTAFRLFSGVDYDQFEEVSDDELTEFAHKNDQLSFTQSPDGSHGLGYSEDIYLVFVNERDNWAVLGLFRSREHAFVQNLSWSNSSVSGVQDDDGGDDDDYYSQYDQVDTAVSTYTVHDELEPTRRYVENMLELAKQHADSQGMSDSQFRQVVSDYLAAHSR